MKKLALVSAVVALGAASSAQAAYQTVDLSPYVNLGFTNSWFINGDQFAPIIGTTTGNQGSSVPFNVANVADQSGQGGNNNFWYGLWGGPGNQLSGSPLSLTIPLSTLGVTTVYTLIDNTFGIQDNLEFSVTFIGENGAETESYIGGKNTKDYNSNCSTTGCTITPDAAYWFIDNSESQWLQVVGWTLPANFGLQSITFEQTTLWMARSLQHHALVRVERGSRTFHLGHDARGLCRPRLARLFAPSRVSGCGRLTPPSAKPLKGPLSSGPFSCATLRPPPILW